MLMIRIIQNWGLIFTLLELAIFILMVNAIGFWATVFLILLSALIGIFLLRLAGVYSVLAIQNNFSSIGVSSPENSLKSMMLMIAGLLFLIPGFITSFFAILCLLPFIGPLLSSRLAAFGYKRQNRGREQQTDTNTASSHIIEGEFRREDP